MFKIEDLLEIVMVISHTFSNSSVHVQILLSHWNKLYVVS